MYPPLNEGQALVMKKAASQCLENLVKTSCRPILESYIRLTTCTGCPNKFWTMLPILRHSWSYLFLGFIGLLEAILGFLRLFRAFWGYSGLLKKVWDYLSKIKAFSSHLEILGHFEVTWNHLRSFETIEVIWGHWGHLRPLKSFRHLRSLRSYEVIWGHLSHLGKWKPF